MVITLLNWSLFIFFILLYLLAYIGFWSMLADNTNKENKGYGLLIFSSGLIAAFMFISAKEVINPNAAVVLWKSLNALTGVSSLIVLIFSDKIKQRIRYYVWGAFFTILISIVPFVIRISVSRSDVTTVGFNNQYFINPIVFTIAIVLTLLIIALIIVIISTTKTRKIAYELLYSIDEYNNRSTSFRKPYEKMYKEDLLSLILLLENKISDLIKINGDNKMNDILQVPKQSSELQNIYQKVDSIQKMLFIMNSNIYNKQIEDLNLVRDLNHFFATPFATIEANVELLSKMKGIDTSYLEKISNSIQLCRCIIETYRECLSFSNNNESVASSLKSTFGTAFEAYTERNNKSLIPLNTGSIPKQFKSYNNHYIISIILPLLENAIQAAPDNTEIIITFDDTNNTISISNSCENTPDIINIQTPGYSSKNNHKGTGIIIVRNLLSIKDRGVLETTIENNKVIQTIKLNKNE